MTIPAQIASVSNPFSGVFGNGEIQMFPNSGTFVVPAGVSRVRVRLWGAGASYSSGNPAGGGFAMRVIQLGAVTSVAVTVGTNAAITGGTSSFGSFVSATGGGSSTVAGGTGIGGDVNYVGGGGNGSQGGSAANLFGNGYAPGNSGGGGPFGVPGVVVTGATGTSIPPTSGMITASIDFLGTGGGGALVNSSAGEGINGGGTGNDRKGGFPGGGGGTLAASAGGGRGFVIVEY